jgi:hypothetical protein
MLLSFDQSPANAVRMSREFLMGIDGIPCFDRE